APRATSKIGLEVHFPKITGYVYLRTSLVPTWLQNLFTSKNIFVSTSALTNTMHIELEGLEKKCESGKKITTRAYSTPRFDCMYTLVDLFSSNITFFNFNRA
ncbi:hypothetical protein ACJX0J_006019, partial [Zea mays]